MEVNEDSASSFEMRFDQIKRIIASQKKITETFHEGWDLSVYWGQLPLFSDCVRLGFMGYASTKDYNSAAKPSLRGSSTQLVVDNRSVIIWTEDNKDLLFDEIQKAFTTLSWKEDNE